jgi:hypothetical protein
MDCSDFTNDVTNIDIIEAIEFFDKSIWLPIWVLENSTLALILPFQAKRFGLT